MTPEKMRANAALKPGGVLTEWTVTRSTIWRLAAELAERLDEIIALLRAREETQDDAT